MNGKETGHYYVVGDFTSTSLEFQFSSIPIATGTYDPVRAILRNVGPTNDDIVSNKYSCIWVKTTLLQVGSSQSTCA